MLKKMTLLALALMAITLSSCGPALDETGAVKPENVRFKGSVAITFIPCRSRLARSFITWKTENPR